MSGPGPGDWQQDAETAAHICDESSSNIYVVVLNPDKPYVLDWLEEARANLARATASLDAAIEKVKATGSD